MRVSGILILSYVLVTPLEGQSSRIEVNYGRWWTGSVFATTYSAALYRPLSSGMSYGLGILHIEDDSLIGRTSTGAELNVAIGRRERGLSFISSVALLVRHDDRNVDASWSAGLAYSYRLLPFLTISADGRYRVEDTEARGFWDLNSRDRTGFNLVAGVTIGSGRSAVPGRRNPVRGPPLRVPRSGPPSEETVFEAGRSAGATEDVAALTSRIVQTAIDVMGTPYEWGGTDENGFDCSGLIKYSYGEHGIIIPRVSRDQARAGESVERRVGDLRPGDILGFALQGSGVSHVGLYIGEGQFIHSGSGGVEISNLSGSGSEGAWWTQRWVAARRIIN